MLQNLKVKNYALISDIEIQFNNGLNIITGETGAGKSILVGALGMVLGKRADSSALRDKEQKCIIEASFNITKYGLQSFFNAHDLDHESVTIIRREITSAGKSRSFINDTPTTLKVLSDLGSRLVEIHSQRDNLQLFNTDFQYHSIDKLAGCSEKTEEFQKGLSRLTNHKVKLKELKTEEANLAKEADYNRYLYKELEEVNLDDINEKELFSEQEMLENAEELINTFNQSSQLLEGSEHTITYLLSDLKQLLTKSRTSLTTELAARVDSVLIELKDIAGEIENSAQEVEVNPERLEEVAEKVSSIHMLKSKHRVESVSDLLTIQDDLSRNLALTLDLSDQISSLELDIANLETKLRRQAAEISKIRKSKSVEISSQLSEIIAGLGMEHSRLKYQLENVEDLNAYGMNSISIELSSDKGNSYADIRKSASGGELARINLSLKNLLANHLDMPSSIYDEIDTGVSGEVARKVGTMMKNMSNDQQVITITHLPQIASLGNHHLFVYKSENKNTVETQVKVLHGDYRISEIAKMISGDNLTEHALEQSKELLSG